MNKTQGRNINLKPLSITTQGLMDTLSCGRAAAVRIGEEAGARVQIGRRVLWNVEKVRAYLDSVSK